MLIFFFIVTIYSAANYYLFTKLSSIIHLGPSIDLLIGALVLFMTLSPVLIPLYSHRGSERSLRLFSCIGFAWLAFLVPFFPASISLDLYTLAVQYYGSLSGSEVSSLLFSQEKSLLFAFLLSFTINAYGYFEAKNLQVERLVIPTSKLPEGVNNVRIAHISDLHLGVIVRDSMLDRVIRTIQNESPDIIVSTGDLVDGIVRHMDHLPERLSSLEAPLGKYAVLGNHEVYGGLKQTVAFTKDAGFVLLRDSAVAIHSSIGIAGMDFRGGETRGYRKRNPGREEYEILSDLPSGLFTLLLKHRSDVEKKSLGRFDLQLSGHSHKGQIFPMSLATMFLFPYHTGFHRLEKGSAIYTSRGAGTAGPPIRFLSSPEITIIDIVAE